MATSCPCYNHDDRAAVWTCLDCKPDCVTKFCKECHEHVHSLAVFRFHRTQTINQGEKRRLSQDISDIEKLVVVEKDILNGVLTTLRYTEQQEREMLQDIVKKTEQRLHIIQQCHEKVDKALMYIAKVSTVITACGTSNSYSAQIPPKGMSTEHQSQVASTSDLPHFPVDVVGSLNKSGYFWMIKKSVADRQRLARIDQDLRNHFKVNPDSAISPAVLKEGTVCVAKSPNNTEFWRIRVEKLSSKEMVKVRYLDYGIQEELPVHSIIDMPPVFNSVPYQAMECCLFPLTMQISLPYEAKWCFKDLTHGKELTATVCSKMVYPQGHRVYHVQLTSSSGPLSVNINQNVADLLAQKEQDDEDLPILPKAELQDQSQTSVVPEGKVDKETEKTDEKMEGDKADENNISVSQPSTESSPSVVISQDSPTQAQEEPQKKITILTKTTDSTKEVDQEDILKKPLDAVTSVTRDASVTVPEYVPIGYVNEQMYCSIYNECNTNKTALRSLVPRARYFIVKGNDRQFVEAMKTKVWCCLDESLACAINNAYQEQAVKHNAVLVIFVLPKVFAGLVRIVSEINWPRPHCTIVSPGLLWGHACRGEFDIQLFSVDKFKFHCLENESYLWTFFKDNVLGREIRAQKGEEICHRYERLRRPYSVLDYACRLYMKDNVPRDLRSSHENLSDDEEPLSWRSKREDPRTTEESKTEESKTGGSKTEGSKTQDDTKTTEDSITNEDWEIDLDAHPARVAEIYSNLSSPSVSQDDNSVECEKPNKIENAVDTDTVVVDDETMTSATSNKLDEIDVPGKPLESNTDVGLDSLDNELDQDLIENRRSTDDMVSTVQDTQLVASQQSSESSLDSNHVVSKDAESTEYSYETDDIVQNTPKEEEEDSNLDEQTSSKGDGSPQELLHEAIDSNEEVILVQETASDVISSIQPAIKEQFPSYMPLGETKVDSLSEKQIVAGNIESQEENKEKFYYVLSPPQTPSSTNVEVSNDDKDGKEDMKVDRHKQDSSNEATEDASCSSNADESKETCLFDREYADDAKTDDIDDEEEEEEEEEAFLPVQPGHRYSVFMRPEASEGDLVWARIVRSAEEEAEFWRFSKELHDWAKTSQELSHVHLLRYCCLKNVKGFYVRTLVTKVHRDDKVTVRFIDHGIASVVPVSHLRELKENFVMSVPPQAFECRILNKRAFKERIRNLKKKTVEVEVDVKAITAGEIAEVEYVDIKPFTPKQK